MSSPTKRASFHTLGCRLNQAETALLEDRLRAAGYAIVPYGEPADLCVINTCTVTNEADAKSRKIIRACIRKHPEAFVAVIGCYAQVAAEQLAAIPGVDLVLGNEHKLRLPDYVTETKRGRARVVCGPIAAADFTIDGCGHAITSRRVNLKIQDGCDCSCSYCLVPTARGPARSRDLGNLVDEARALVARGAKELVLAGVNVGAYAFEGRSIVDVVDALNAVDGLRRIRFGSVELTALSDALLDRMRAADHALVPHLHIPLQAGSDRVLRAMRRPCTAREYVDFVRRAQARVSGLGVGADIMVGFPGETEEDFEQTLGVLREAALSYAHVFQYSDRPGADAARMAGKVPPPVMERRSVALRASAAEKQREFHAAHVGVTAEVLFEQREDAGWCGYTGNYVRVAVRSSENLENEIRSVVLEHDAREYMQGRLA